jgi:hypothetical protein
MIEGSSDEAMVLSFAGAQREGIGRFGFDPAAGRWWWTDVIFEVLGVDAGSPVPSWSSILQHIPHEERAAVEAAFRDACTRTGPFSWSHRVNATDGRVRSILVLGQTTPPAGAASSTEPATAVTGTSGGLQVEGFVIDLTVLRVEGAKAAARHAVAASRAHQAVIEQAKGAVMLAHRIDADAAFALLVWNSQKRNQKVHVIAAELVGQFADGLGDCNQRLLIDRVISGQSRGLVP